MPTPPPIGSSQDGTAHVEGVVEPSTVSTIGRSKTRPTAAAALDDLPRTDTHRLPHYGRADQNDWTFPQTYANEASLVANAVTHVDLLYRHRGSNAGS
jgi:hypothetical protein